MSKGSVLIVEDEESIARFMELELKYEGYTVDIASDGRIGLDKVKAKYYDILILDIMLPKLNGMELCKKIREFSETPIIMVTSKSDTSDIVTGLDIGADDYITKPFDMEVLMARMRKVMKKKSAVSENILTLKNISMNDSRREVLLNGIKVELSKTEFELLKYFIINVNIVLTRYQILNNVWGYDFMGGENVVDVYVRYLREKLGEDTIQTIRGVGYTMREN